jgi:hypothetical protein
MQSNAAQSTGLPYLSKFPIFKVESNNLKYKTEILHLIPSGHPGDKLWARSVARSSVVTLVLEMRNKQWGLRAWSRMDALADPSLAECRQVDAGPLLADGVRRYPSLDCVRLTFASSVPTQEDGHVGGSRSIPA